MHRDLKPENFLFGNKKESAPLKAIDFGLSVFFKPGKLTLNCQAFDYLGCISLPYLLLVCLLNLLSFLVLLLQAKGLTKL